MAEGGFGEQTPHEDGLIGSGDPVRFKDTVGNLLNIGTPMLNLCGSHTPYLYTQLASISFILTRTLNLLCDRAYLLVVTAIALGSSLHENTISNNT